ncbi:transcription factor MYB64-like [Solanum pennellii]|uniref:Transcription factor MYB64-like n=1 Tax=Solanum pennellii TaxID=28526 RepID=A0ABM1UW92_SOLPN|nr:transcription factor MYB64-like [Solanum pennellii]
MEEQENSADVVTGGYYDGTSGYNSNFPEQSLKNNVNIEENGAQCWNNQEQKKTGKKAKEVTMLVKGQWTEEEDRNLMKLVKQFGLKRWAQIAENMVGRAGKQCRERWHNHLRPDIKKETWSEEEEVMLVEAHKQIGNKWAEIGKRIPGRTENAIKNHWNATKRRQISRRNKLKKEERSNVLQDYIRNKYFSDDMSISSSSSTTPPTNDNNNMKNPCPYLYPYSDDDDDTPSLLTNQTYDDEMNFMQKLFGNNSLDGANMTTQHQLFLHQAEYDQAASSSFSSGRNKDMVLSSSYPDQQTSTNKFF